MTTPRGYRDRSDDSLFALIGEIPELVRNLVVAEIDSAKSWAKKAGKDAGMGGAWFLVALFFAFWAIPVLGAMLIMILAIWMPGWLAALIVLVLLLVIAVVFALMGVARMKRLTRSQNPVQAITVDARIVKDAVDEH
ncbi:phage holin family protein [Microbacterium sp.]|uniref:phage holin family protein n=1 Tax=Microbacterium sp. TaxID=51671 RepID=UPI0039E25CE3